MVAARLLDDAAIEGFRRDGHVLVRGLVPRTELRAARQASRRLLRQTIAEAVARGDVEAGAAPGDYVPVLGLAEREESLRRIVRSPRLGAVATALLGVDAVRVYHDELFVKPPGGIATFWHQDQVYWPVDTSPVVDDGEIGMLRIWLTLTDLPVERGGLWFLTGSHRGGPMAELRAAPPVDGGRAWVDGVEVPMAGYGHLDAGDATVHAGYTVHAAGPNTTEVARLGLTVAFLPDGARVGTPSTDVHEQNISRFLGGRRPGARIHGPGNPLVRTDRRRPAAVVAPTVDAADIAEAPTVTAASMEGVFDIELTTRCNASCTFCPRDRTPHLGMIDDATFAMAVARAVEYRNDLRDLRAQGVETVALPEGTIWLTFCGMGDAMVHPRVVDHTRHVAEAGLLPLLTTNGALLSAARVDALLDAGVAWICVNAGEVGDEYERVYGLPFQRTHDNLVALAEKAQGRCRVTIALVDHRGDPQHVQEVARFWAERGLMASFSMDLVNRGGSLHVPDQEAAHRDFGAEAAALFAERGVVPRCATPMVYPFVGYDGRYYLCSSDWQKQVPVGTVAEHSVFDLFGPKHRATTTRDPICRNCTHDPVNVLARALATRHEVASAGLPTGDADDEVGRVLARQVQSMHAGDRAVRAALASQPPAPVHLGPPRRRPVPARS